MKKLLIKKLKQTRKQVSKKWYNYSVEKAKILSDESLSDQDKYFEVKNLLKVTRGGIKSTYKDYQGEKYAVTHHSPLVGFKFTKHQDREQIQDYFTARKDYNPDDLDGLVKNILDKPKVLGVTVIYESLDKDTGLKAYGSDFINKKQLDKIYENYNSIDEYLSDKIKKAKTPPDFHLERIHIRVIYSK